MIAIHHWAKEQLAWLDVVKIGHPSVPNCVAILTVYGEFTVLPANGSVMVLYIQNHL